MRNETHLQCLVASLGMTQHIDYRIATMYGEARAAGDGVKPPVKPFHDSGTRRTGGSDTPK